MAAKRSPYRRKRFKVEFRSLFRGGPASVEATDMYPATPCTAGTSASCVGQSQATHPPGQHEAKEVDLLAGLQARDKTAFREIVERYGSKIYNVCFGILQNRDDAEEIAQEVFVKVHFSIQRFDGRSSLYSWISRIAVNECYGFLRTKRFKSAHSDDSLGATLTRHMEAVKGERPTPDPTVLQRIFINELLTHIPEDECWLLVSKEVEGFSLAELSQMAGLSEKATKSRLFRARQRLVAAAARRLRKFSAAQSV
jgi:RNA polymerase sigma-70 factor (ECF subfamily)